MHLLELKHLDSSEDEESDEEMPEHESGEEEDESEDGDENMDSGHPKTADSQSSEEEEEQGDVENEEDEEDDEPNGHPYPTPPPDADANKSLGNGVKKVVIPKPKLAKATKNKMADGQPGMMKPKKMGSIITLALKAITEMKSRSGSSVQAIVKYMKSNGYVFEDERRMGKLVLRALKNALTKGQVVQVRRSFKISESMKKDSMAVEKMKMKKIKMKAKEKVAKAEAKLKELEKETAKAKKAKTMMQKKKPSERKTNEPARKKINPKIAGVAGDAKVAAGVKAQAALEGKKPKAMTEKMDKATPEATNSSKSITKTKAKAKMPRKSIGTLAQPLAKPKPQAKAIKKLISGKGQKSGSDIDSDSMDLLPNESSTPVAPTKQGRKGRMVK